MQNGDTVAGLAQRFGTTIEMIALASGLDDPESIIAGQVLLIPNASLTPTPAPENPVGSGWTMPIEGGCLPTAEALWPNAPRDYRFGIHEGIDFYEYDNCVEIPEGAPVLAASDGIVLRADHGFVEMTPALLDELLTRSEMQGYTDAEALDRFRGRQVWIDHGDGIVTRYAHLSDIPKSIQEGVSVSAGDVVGFVGDSGTPEAVTNPGLEIHLHFEIRVGDSFLGADLPLETVQYLYNEVFAGQ